MPGDRTAGLSDGRPVIFGVRPEHFSPASARRAARKGHPSVMVPARVEMDEPTGAETILMCRIAGQEAVVVCEPDEAPRPGDSVEFEIDMSKVSLFDPETENRL